MARAPPWRRCPPRYPSASTKWLRRVPRGAAAAGSSGVSMTRRTFPGGGGDAPTPPSPRDPPRAGRQPVDQVRPPAADERPLPGGNGPVTEPVTGQAVRFEIDRMRHDPSRPEPPVQSAIRSGDVVDMLEYGLGEGQVHRLALDEGGV